jgi:hypothetical protein
MRLIKNIIKSKISPLFDFSIVSPHQQISNAKKSYLSSDFNLFYTTISSTHARNEVLTLETDSVIIQDRVIIRFLSALVMQTMMRDNDISNYEFRTRFLSYVFSELIAFRMAGNFEAHHAIGQLLSGNLHFQNLFVHAHNRMKGVEFDRAVDTALIFLEYHELAHIIFKYKNDTKLEFFELATDLSKRDIIFPKSNFVMTIDDDLRVNKFTIKFPNCIEFHNADIEEIACDLFSISALIDNVVSREGEGIINEEGFHYATIKHIRNILKLFLCSQFIDEYIEKFRRSSLDNDSLLTIDADEKFLVRINSCLLFLTERYGMPSVKSLSKHYDNWMYDLFEPLISGALAVRTGSPGSPRGLDILSGSVHVLFELHANDRETARKCLSRYENFFYHQGRLKQI